MFGTALLVHWGLRSVFVLHIVGILTFRWLFSCAAVL